jgi:hypothetical protein
MGTAIAMPPLGRRHEEARPNECDRIDAAEPNCPGGLWPDRLDL